MKKYLIGLFLLLLLTACGTNETAQNDLNAGAIANNAPSAETDESEEDTTVATATESETAVAEENEEEEVAADTAVSPIDGPTYQPASDIATAAILRDSDQTKGATEPIIAIIEYGDFQ